MKFTIKDGCRIICKLFAHSPVFRFGGDEFVVIVKGKDYTRLDEIMENIAEINLANKEQGKIVMAAGMCRYKGEGKLKQLFEIADGRMYENKRELKELSSYIM